MSDPNMASLFDEIYNSTNNTVLAFITVKCKHTADISDIFQDTYMELYRVLIKHGAEYVTNSRALVLQIAKRKLARHYSFMERLRFRESANFWYDAASDATLRDKDMVLSEFADPFLTEDFAVNQVMLKTAKDFIQAKPEPIQKVFYLMYDVGMTIPEIAKALAMNESNVKNRLYRTLKELRTILR